MKYLGSIAQASRLEQMWQCDKCQYWHFQCKPISPSGESSGTGMRRSLTDLRTGKKIKI